MKTLQYLAISALTATLAITGSCTSPPAEAQEAAPGLREQLQGAWAFAGRPGEVYEPEPGGQVKFWGQRHWIVTQWDPETGHVTFHHGGTYTLEGDRYVETVTFATANIAEFIGESFRFTISVEGDTFTQIGDGNEYHEVWKRLVQ